METNQMLIEYEKMLRRQEMAENTIKSYVGTAKRFLSTYEAINRNNILAYKEHLISNYKPATVNNRILALNHFLHYLRKDTLKLKTMKVQQKLYLDNVISNTDYRKLIRNLKKDGKKKWYMIVRTMVCTGARIGEIIAFQAEDVYAGYIELYAKGSKLRRIYFPEMLQAELIGWLEEDQRKEGPLFLNKNGVTISANGIATMFKKFALQYHIDPKVMHPHAFRHRFALNFLSRKPNDIVLLADILGHSNINTTRIYTRRTAQEQYRIINAVVDW